MSEVFNVPEAIRLASDEEVAEIAKTSLLTPMSSVYKFRNNKAVIRTAIEIDPVMFSPSAALRERAMFIWGLENMLRATGAREYFFNVAASDEDWQKAVEHWKAERTSAEPEYRYRKEL